MGAADWTAGFFRSSARSSSVVFSALLTSTRFFPVTEAIADVIPADLPPACDAISAAAAESIPPNCCAESPFPGSPVSTTMIASPGTCSRSTGTCPDARAGSGKKRSTAAASQILRSLIFISPSIFPPKGPQKRACSSYWGFTGTEIIFRTSLGDTASISGRPAFPREVSPGIRRFPSPSRT